MNIDKILNIVAWCCLPLAGFEFLMGGEFGTNEGAKIVVKVLGLSLLVYGIKCIKAGKENFLTEAWYSGVVTNKGEAFLFWLAMVLLLALSVTRLLR